MQDMRRSRGRRSRSTNGRATLQRRGIVRPVMGGADELDPVSIRASLTPLLSAGPAGVGLPSFPHREDPNGGRDIASEHPAENILPFPPPRPITKRRRRAGRTTQRWEQEGWELVVSMENAGPWMMCKRGNAGSGQHSRDNASKPSCTSRAFAAAATPPSSLRSRRNGSDKKPCGYDEM